MSTEMNLKNLDAATIPLIGRHLIEASAGTGKTYNITRIYLRLILERELSMVVIKIQVENCLFSHRWAYLSYNN